MGAINFVKEKPWVFGKLLAIFLGISIFSWWNFKEFGLGIIAVVLIIMVIMIINWRFFDEISDAFLEIEKEDSMIQKSQKAANTMGARIAYSFLEYGLAAVSVALVVAMKNMEYSFWQTVVTMWIMIDITSAGATVWLYEKTGRDIPLSRKYRKAWDVVMQHSRQAGIAMIACQCVLATFWDGPDYTVLFFRQELKTHMMMTIVLIILTIMHAIIWTAVYWFSYDNIVDLIKFFVN